MATLDILEFGTKFDDKNWRKGFALGEKLRSEFEKGGPIKMGGMVQSAPNQPELATPPAPIPLNIAGDFRKALAPMAGIMGKQAAIFEKMAGSILATNRRLDGDIKYDKFQSTVSKLRAHVLKDFEDMDEKGRKRAKALDTALGAAAGFSRFRNNLDSMVSINRKASAEIDRIRPKLLSFGAIGSTAAGAVAGAVEKTHLSFKTLAVGIGLAVGPAILFKKSFDFIKGGIADASNLGETISKNRAIFGEVSGSVEGFADTMSAKFGAVRNETLSVAAGFGGLFKGLGDQSGQALADSSEKMTKMALDLSSYANTSLGEAGQAIRTALSGETSDVLKGLGVITTENTVKAYAYSHGIAKIGDELTESGKLAARAGLIYEGLADAQNDIDKTSGSAANRMRALSGKVAEFGTQIGETLMPVVTAGLSMTHTLVDLVTKAFADNRPAIDAAVESVADFFRIGDACYQNLGATFAVLRLKSTELFTNLGGWTDSVWQNFANQVGYVGRVTTSFFGDLAHNALAALGNVGDNFASLGESMAEFFTNPLEGFNVRAFKPITDGFRQTVEALPKEVAPFLIDLSKEIAEAGRPIAATLDKSRDLAAKSKGAVPTVGQAAAGVVKKAAISEKLEEFVKEFTEGIKTPLAKYKEKMELAKQALDQKLISPEMYKKADAFARKESGMENKRFAGAEDLGTREAYSTIVQASTGRGNEYGLKLQTRMLTVQESIDKGIRELNKGSSAKNDAPTISIMRVA